MPATLSVQAALLLDIHVMYCRSCIKLISVFPTTISTSPRYQIQGRTAIGISFTPTMLSRWKLDPPQSRILSNTHLDPRNTFDLSRSPLMLLAVALTRRMCYEH